MIEDVNVQFIAHCFAGKEGIVTKKEYYDFREEENTRQVNLFLLVQSALKSWKLILLAGVILGCLFGGYKILSIHSKKDAMIEDYDTYAAKRDAYKKSLQEYKQSVADLQTRIDKRIEYVENSPKMQLNATNAPTAICEIKISNVEDGTLKAEDFTMIKTAIYNEILFGDSLSPLAEKYGVSLVNLREMIMAPRFPLSAPPSGSLCIMIRWRAPKRSERIFSRSSTASTRILQKRLAITNLKYLTDRPNMRWILTS